MVNCPCKPKEKLGQMLLEAHGIINADRLKDYGDPADSFKRIAELWSTHLGVKVLPQDVAVMMILMKTARLKGSGFTHRDSVVDIAGYAGLLEHV